MYKSHCDKWALQKNLKSQIAEELLRQKTKRDNAGKATRMYINNKEIATQKLKTYLERTSKQNKDRICAAAERGR